MKKYVLIIFALITLGIYFMNDFSLYAIAQSKNTEQELTEYNMPKLNELETHVILNKGTERPFSGIYNDHKEDGIYICRQCGQPLYRSEDKFDSGTGWPSFDDEIKPNVERVRELFGVEVVCANCGGHLGHVFEGEKFTEKNTRHCINSVSLSFVPTNNNKTAVFAGGCFWGVEANFEKIPGVLDVVSGYSGGSLENPTYEQVITGKTGHAESVEVTYDSSKVDYETLARAFFELHDPTHFMHQGPDYGSQYRSVLFYHNEEEKIIAEKLIKILKEKGYDVVTELTPFEKFYPAEEYHQDYIKKTGRSCSLPVKRFS